MRTGLALFAIALLPRLILLFAGPWVDTERARFGDSSRYLNLAANLKSHGSFGLPDEEPARAWYGVFELRRENGTLPPPDAHGLHPELLRTPGYPLFVAVVSTLAGGDLRAVLFVQCVLGATAAACVRKIGLAVGLSPRAALAAGLIWGLHPATVGRDSQFMTESLFNALGVFGLYFSACGPRGWTGGLLAGMCFGYAGLVRPLAVLYLPAAMTFLVRRGGKRWVAAVVLVAVTVLPSVGWMARNHTVGHGFRLSVTGDVTLFYYTAGYSLSEERGKDWLREWPNTSEELLAKLRPRVKPGDDVYDQMRTLAVEELKARPGVVATVFVKSWVKLWMAHSAEEVYQLVGRKYEPKNIIARLILGEDAQAQPAAYPGELVLLAVWVGGNVFVAGAVVVGAALAVRRREWAFALPLVLTVTLFMAATLSNGMERFRTPIFVAVALLAGRVLGPLAKSEARP